jgi:hypothetical protein
MVWIRTQRAAVASRLATNLASHLTKKKVDLGGLYAVSEGLSHTCSSCRRSSYS